MSIIASLQLDKGEFRLDANFSMRDPGVTALFGPSGSGKTTLLRCIAGLEKSKGSLSVNGTIWQNSTENVFVLPHQRGIGFVFQDTLLFPHLNVRENLEYAEKRVDPQNRTTNQASIVELTGIGHLLGRSTRNLSGGERQRVAIARALLSSPQVLLLDEPMAALDEKGKSALFPWLERLPQELAIPIIYVSHAIDEIARLADSMILLNNGLVSAPGPLDDLLARLDLPLTQMEGALSVLNATVDYIDSHFSLSVLKVGKTEIYIPRDDLVPGNHHRIIIQANSVSLALDRAGHSSILNIIPATVTGLTDSGDSRVMVRLEAEGSSLLSRITRKSAASLNITAGQQLFAQVKSVVLLD